MKRATWSSVTVFLLLLAFLSAGWGPEFEFTGFAVFRDSGQADFDSGAYNNTAYNATEGFIQLCPGNLSGTYTSRVFDAGGEASWNSLSWVRGAPYGSELPGGQAAGSGNCAANMTGNVLLLHMNGNWSDASGTGNNGTAVEASFSASSKLGSHAGLFDGENDYVDCGSGNTLDICQTLSIGAWVKPETTAPSHGYHSTIVNHGNSYWFLILKTGELSFLRFKDSSYDLVSTDAIVPGGEWSHVAVSYDSGSANEVRLYINGELSKSGSLDGPMDSVDSILSVGDRGNLHYFNGSMDELALWNRSLGADEVLCIYERGTLRLDMSARSCNDSACSGEAWGNVNGSSATLSVPERRYFQYMAVFGSDDTEHSPELCNVTVDYALNANAPSTPVMNSPGNNTFREQDWIVLNATSTDPNGDDITYSFYGDGELINTTTLPSGSDAIYNWTGPGLGVHNWSVKAGDGVLESGMSETRYITVYTTESPETVYIPQDCNELGCPEGYACESGVCTKTFYGGAVVYRENETEINRLESRVAWLENMNEYLQEKLHVAEQRKSMQLQELQRTIDYIKLQEGNVGIISPFGVVIIVILIWTSFSIGYRLKEALDRKKPINTSKGKI